MMSIWAKLDLETLRISTDHAHKPPWTLNQSSKGLSKQQTITK